MILISCPWLPFIIDVDSLPVGNVDPLVELLKSFLPLHQLGSLASKQSNRQSGTAAYPCS